MVRTSAVTILLVSAILMTDAQTSNKETPTQFPANFIDGYIDIESIGVPPKDLPVGSPGAYADARRAAYLLASRELAERLAGMYLNSSTSLDDQGATDFADILKVELKKTWTPGGVILKQSSFGEFERERLVRMIVRFQLSSVLPMLMGDLAPHLREVESKLPIAPLPKPLHAAPAPAFDSLIVKVPAGFHTSITPKLFNSKGQLIYGSGSLAINVLIANGIVAQFAATEERAKAALASHGAKHPLVISGYLHPGDKDIDLEDDDANRVLREDSRGNFLKRGRVFIVVGS